MSGAILAAVGVLMTIVGIVLSLAAYLAPSIVALIRKAPNTASVAAVNVLLGWSLIGWAVALAMALRDPARTRANGPVTIIQNAGPNPPPPINPWTPPALPPGGPYDGPPADDPNAYPWPPADYR